MDISKKFLSKEKLDCSLLCAEPFASFRRHEKKRKERLEKEYKSKEVRLKTTYKYKADTPDRAQRRGMTNKDTPGKLLYYYHIFIEQEVRHCRTSCSIKIILLLLQDTLSQEGGRCIH